MEAVAFGFRAGLTATAGVAAATEEEDIDNKLGAPPAFDKPSAGNAGTAATDKAEEDEDEEHEDDNDGAGDAGVLSEDAGHVATTTAAAGWPEDDETSAAPVPVVAPCCVC
jgi:hypothetical protein